MRGKEKGGSRWRGARSDSRLQALLLAKPMLASLLLEPTCQTETQDLRKGTAGQRISHQRRRKDEQKG